MSFTEQQIRALARDELKKILDTGFMCTEQVGAKTTTQTPSILPKPPTTPQINGNLDTLPDEIKSKLAWHPDGTVTTTEFIKDKELWAKIADAMKNLGYKWVGNGKLSHWER